MKKYCCILFFFQSLLAVAQKDTLNKWRQSVSLDFSISGRNYGANIAPGFCLENNKNHFSLAPLIMVSDNKSGFTFTGIKFNYAFYPGERQKTVDFYFDYDFLFQRITVNERFYELNSSTFKENVITYLENYIGYGFKVRTLHHLYITHGVGIGYVFAHSKLYNSNDPYRGGYHEDSFSGIIKVGFEYYFH